jgi:hypothetical protein
VAEKKVNKKIFFFVFFFFFITPLLIVEMSQFSSLFFELPMNILSALILVSCLVWCVIMKAVGGLVDICADIVVVVFPELLIALRF